MRRLPNLKALPAFELTARHASITAAAQELHLTHGAVSRQIKALEESLGVPLFQRFNRRIELTPAGAQLLPSVRQVLDLLEKAASGAAARSKQEPLVVSCLATFMMRWLIPKLYAFNAAHPSIELRLSASHAPVAFDDQTIDVAIRLGKPPWPRGAAVKPFLRDRMGPVLAPALLRRHRIERPEDLKGLTLLHSETRPSAWADWMRLTGTQVLDVSNGPRFEHTHFLLEAAASSLGAAIGSHPLVQQDLESGRLIAPFGFVESGNEYCVLHPAKSHKRAKIAAFSKWIGEQAS